MMISDQGIGAASRAWPNAVSVAEPGAGFHGAVAQFSVPAIPGLSELALGVQPRHALCGGMLRAAEASLRCAAGGAAGAGGNAGEMSARMSFWLLEAACREAQLWNAAPAKPAGGPASAVRSAPAVVVSVEMPARSLREGRLVAQARTALERASLSPLFLEIVLPEYALTDGGTEVLLGMSALRDLGVGLALDRFGSVSASLRLLQRLPLTAVKLDPGLTHDLVHDRETRSTVGAAIGLAHALNTVVIATGVDCAAQRDVLADLGCDDAQGRLFGAPMAADVFRAALRWE
jgi:EAL domain-containing protein (putative c-di-GMP-specific phosphodiesterase class I)